MARTTRFIWAWISRIALLLMREHLHSRQAVVMVPTHFFCVVRALRQSIDRVCACISKLIDLEVSCQTFVEVSEY